MVAPAVVSSPHPVASLGAPLVFAHRGGSALRPENTLTAFDHGLSLGAAARYSSSTVVSRSVDWNPLNGGFQAGNFLVFDTTAAYSWDLVGYRVTSNLGIYNVTDKKYFEGTYVASPRRQLLLTNTMKF